MQKESFHGAHVQWAWDATSLDLAQTCPRKYYYTMIRGVKPRQESVHLLFGGIYASALEHFYKHRALGDDIDTATRKVVHEALIASWDAEEGKPKNFEDTNKTRPNLIRTIVWYLAEFAEETSESMKTYHLQSGEPAVELSFRFELHSDIVYCGHLDRVVEYSGAKYVMDQKSTGRTISSYYFKDFDTSNQMSGYTLAGKIVLNSPVRGVIIDAAQVAVNFTNFQRGITTRSRDQLDEWAENTLTFITRFQEIADGAQDEERKWPMNLTACGNYGGCPFRPVCAKSPSIRENILKTDYREHVWDPVVER